MDGVRDRQNSPPEQGEAPVSISLPFDQFDEMHLPFHAAIGTHGGQGCFKSGRVRTNIIAGVTNEGNLLAPTSMWASPSSAALAHLDLTLAMLCSVAGRHEYGSQCWVRVVQRMNQVPGMARVRHYTSWVRQIPRRTTARTATNVASSLACHAHCRIGMMSPYKWCARSTTSVKRPNKQRHPQADTRHLITRRFH